MPRFLKDFGITGFDCCEDEKLVNNGFKYLKNLKDEIPEGNGRLVFFGKEGTDLSRLENPRIVTSFYYQNLADKKAKELFTNYQIIPVYGKTESYVPEYADIGFDFKSLNPNGTVERNGLIVLEEVMKTYTVLISRPELCLDDFEDIFERGGEK